MSKSSDIKNLSAERDHANCDVCVKYKHEPTHQTYELHIYYTTEDESVYARKVYGWVCLMVYSKRRDIKSNEYLKLMTGRNPMVLLSFLKEAYPKVEREFLQYVETVGLPCQLTVCGSNSKRQNLYDRLLLPLGFTKSRCNYCKGGVTKEYSLDKAKEMLLDKAKEMLGTIGDVSLHKQRGE